ncbi:MAG: porin family protein [Conchiformibius sp.]|nr:porin family protein [Conchiformibius sp.]
MKKLSLLILGALASASVLAAPADKNFTGASVGAEIGTTKYKVKNANVGTSAKNTKDFTLTGGYGFEYGDSNFIGEVGAKAKVNNSKALTYTREYADEKIQGKVDEKQRLSVGYSQGYRVTSDLMPYAKVDYIHSRMKETGNKANGKVSMNGVGVGVGAKYAVAPNVEIGAEYVHSRLRSKKLNNGNRVKMEGNSFNTGVSYRF